MAWKVDENGAFVAQDGAPVWIYDEGDNKGSEAPVDFSKTLKSISDIKAESIGRKQKLKEYADRYKPLEDAGIADFSEYLAKANDAITKVQNLSDKQLVDAGEVEKIKQQAQEVFDNRLNHVVKTNETKIAELQNAIGGKDESIRNLIIKGAFDRSEFLKDKTVLPSDFAYAQLGSRFVVEESAGGLRGYAVDAEGNKLMSAKNPAEYADPDEAIELLVMSHPQRDRILKMDASGGGTPPGGHGPGAKDLKSKYDEAISAGNITEAIRIKNQMAKKK